MGDGGDKVRRTGPAPGVVKRATAAKGIGPEAAKSPQPTAATPATVARVAAPAQAPAAARAADAKELQRTVGNRAISRAMAAPGATTSTTPAPAGVSHPADASEKEASAVARAVASGKDASPQPAGGAAPVARAEADAGEQARDRPPLAPAAAAAVGRPGPGRQIPGGTRHTLERRMGADLGHVRVHQGDEADEAARSIDARAFTHGPDVWLGEGESADDLELMAHEAAHVVQNDRGAVPRVHRKNGGKGKGAKGGGKKRDYKAEYEKRKKAKTPTEGASLPDGKATGVFDEAGKKVVFDALEIPAFKTTKKQYDGRALVRRANYRRGDPDQRALWRTKVGEKAKTATKQELEKKIAPGPADAAAVYVFEAPGWETGKKATGAKPKPGKRVFAGTLDDLAVEMSLPSWTSKGAGREYHVDHIVELQLANWNANSPDTKFANNPEENMELLYGPANTESGRTIDAEIRRRAEAFRKAVATARAAAKAPAGEDPPPPFSAKVDELLEMYSFEFSGAKPGKGTAPPGGDGDGFWSYEKITKGEHVAEGAPVTRLDPSKMGDDDTVLIFPASGSRPFSMTAKKEPGPGEAGMLRPFVLTGKDFKTADANDPLLGTVSLAVRPGKAWKPAAAATYPIPRVTGAKTAGAINRREAMKELKSRLAAQAMSPVEILDADIEPGVGWVAQGEIRPGFKLLEGASIDFTLRGDDVTFSKTFTAEDISVPAPFRLDEASLTLAWTPGGKDALSVKGELFFGIDKVGRGSISAKAGSSGDILLTGGFGFESELFDPASISIEYLKKAEEPDGHLTMSGTIGIGEGKVPGIRSAQATVTYGDGKLAATGDVELSVPGVEKGSLALTYSENEGLSVTGTIALRKDIPGLKSGSLEATVARRPDGSGYKVSAKGTAEPSIPGLSSSRIDLSYDDGAFTAEARAAFEKGMVKGEVMVGLSNRTPDKDGNLTDPEGKELKVYGRGSATVRLAPWLQGTATIALRPNGEIDIVGTVALPSTFEVFPEKRFDKKLLSIGVDIPIFGVAFAGQRIGIFARIAGGIDLEAGVGPGRLKDAAVSIAYNPAHEDETRIWGGATLDVPAFAGVRLFVEGSVGAGIPIVSARVGLQVGARLGVAGALQAGVQVDWTPKKGLVLDATGHIEAQPVLTVDVTGFALVEADLWLTTIELYSEKWQLAALQLGSALKVGMTFPVHYEEGKGVDLSLDKVQLELPAIEPGQLLTDLMAKVT